MLLRGDGPVLVTGDVMEDIIVKPQGPMVPGSDARADIYARPGGSGANQALWLAAAGVPVTFVARVGAPDVARYRALFAARGVDPLIAGDDGLATGRLVTLVDADGERSFFTDRGANARLGRGDLPPDILAGVSLLHISGYALFAAEPRDAVLQLAGDAGAAGIPVSIDPSSAGFLREAGAEAFLEWTRGMAMCFANRDEAALLSGSADPAEQVGRLGQYYELAILKRGADGAMAGNRAGIIAEAPAPEITPVDTTGAGDAFFAGFVAALRRGADIAACLASGNALGGRAATQLGGQPAATQ